MRVWFAFAAGFLGFAPGCLAAESAWNGHWLLDRGRSEPEGAADDYRFTVGEDGSLKWEIPSLKEVNVGRLDGTPMAINRPGGTPEQTISVWVERPGVWRYRVMLKGENRGGGRMTLAADGKSWTDVPLDGDRPVAMLTMVYVKG